MEALKEGVKPDVLDDLGAEGPADALNEGVKPVLGAAAFGASGAAFSDVEPLLPSALKKRLEVAVAGGLTLGVEEGVDDLGVGVLGSAGRERLNGVDS